jgi:hypothetical protein
MSTVSLDTTQTNTTMKHKEQMKDVAKALQYLTIEFRTQNGKQKTSLPS